MSEHSGFEKDWYFDVLLPSFPIPRRYCDLSRVQPYRDQAQAHGAIDERGLEVVPPVKRLYIPETDRQHNPLTWLGFGQVRSGEVTVTEVQG